MEEEAEGWGGEVEGRGKETSGFGVVEAPHDQNGIRARISALFLLLLVLLLLLLVVCMGGMGCVSGVGGWGSTFFAGRKGDARADREQPSSSKPFPFPSFALSSPSLPNHDPARPASARPDGPQDALQAQVRWRGGDHRRWAGRGRHGRLELQGQVGRGVGE